MKKKTRHQLNISLIKIHVNGKLISRFVQVKIVCKLKHQLNNCQYFYPMSQILFKPVLQSLGLHVESVRPSAMMKKFGGHLLLQGHITTFKILIAESEARPGEGGHYASQYSSKGKGRGKRSFNNRGLAESAAFQCER